MSTDTPATNNHTPDGLVRRPPELTDLDERAGEFWEKHALNTVCLHPHLDPYVPGLTQRVNAYRDSRHAIYLSVLDAWRAAGRPGDFLPEADADVRGYVEHAACLDWYATQLTLASCDHAVEEIRQKKAALLAGRAAPPRATVPGATVPGTVAPAAPAVDAAAPGG